MRYKKHIVSALVVIAATSYILFAGKKSDSGYVTHEVSRGDIIERITASGAINPVSTINIGTQVSGTIQEIHVDFNSAVSKGQLIAQIDPALFDAAVAQRNAALKVAKAEVDVINNEIIFNKKHLDRIRKLNKEKYSTDKELEAAERDYANSLAQLQLRQAQVKQAEAALLSAEIDLKYTKIVSPVDGIVISREVEVGQTVAASFQTPTLFMIAEDLTKMEIIASVVEADISKVERGQFVEFSVDSFSDEVFQGMVTQVRNNPITTQNVVTYEVIIEVNNQDKRLKPGMTANVEIITAEKKDIIIVPNQALRFYVTEPDGSVIRYKEKGLWIYKNGKISRENIKIGVYNDEHTEILSDNIKEGMEVVLEKKGAADTKNAPAIRMRMPR